MPTAPAPDRPGAYDCERFLAMMHSVDEGLCIVDKNWRVEFINETFAQMFGVGAAEAVGKTTFELNPEFRNSIFFEGHEQALLRRESTVRVGHSGRLNKHLMVRSYPFEDGMAIFVHNLGEELERYQRFVFLANHDELTSLPNRVALSEAVSTQLEAGRPFCLGFIDLDRFKNVNDTQGHSVGDRLLMEVSSRFKTVLDKTGTLYRMGGDEFIALIPGSSVREAQAVLANLLAAATEKFVVARHEFVLGATGGAVEAPKDGSSFETLVRRADLALYEAKSHRRGEIAWFEPKFEETAIRRVELEWAIRNAIAKDEFEMYYQPKANTRGLGCIGAEALIRWNHPLRGFIAPSEFLPVARDCGLMQDIDAWVLRRTIRDISMFRSRGLRQQVSINLSAESLSDAGLYDTVVNLLSEHKVPAEMVELEITESTLMENVESGESVLSRLANFGVSFSVDDFGTGYSSMSYLTRFPVRVLKIDCSFVQNMVKDVSSQKVVRGIIALAHSLEMRAVAEGVETVSQLRQLAEFDCDFVQGFFFGRPMPREEFLLFAVQHAAEPTWDFMPGVVISDAGIRAPATVSLS